MFAEIVIPKTLLDTLTYKIPSELSSQVKIGSLVKIKLKERDVSGIVVEIKDKTNIGYTKDIAFVTDTEFISKELLSLLVWVKKYYLVPWGQLLTLALPLSVYNYKPIKKFDNSKFETKRISITNEYQVDIIKEIIDCLKQNRHKTFLLRNAFMLVNDIYLPLIKETIRLNKSVIILIPEIHLSSKFITILENQIGNNVFCYHSGLKQSERKNIWYQIKNTEASIILGMRSAIFAPVKNLGLIIVEAEHHLSYKEQERHFHYNARDIAIVRSQLNKSVTVLASNTPSTESFYNAKSGKYRLITITKLKRKSKGQIVLLDMRQSRNKVISPKLSYEIKNAFRNDKQIVLYLNRRGYAKQISCAECGYFPKCNNCGISLALLREQNVFLCSLCKSQQPTFDFCPQCHGNDFIYQGIGTQRVVSEIKKILPKTNISRLDSDAIKNSSLSKIIITTQLGIKRLNFSQIGLFGIISADTNLYLPDFRAQEKTFQELSNLIAQCAFNDDCKIIIQTYHSHNYAIYYAVQDNYLKFYEQEIKLRKKLKYPPYTHLSIISVQSAQLNQVEQIANEIKNKLNAIKDIVVLGPTLTKTKRKPHIITYQLLVKTKPNQSLSNFISRYDLSYDKVVVDINVDPI